MGRTATNVLGNSIATAVIAKWEGAIGQADQEEEDETLPTPQYARKEHAVEALETT
jgi:Na+/H+-dicarboxylate symporter